MPFIFFVILVTVVFGRSIFLIFLAIGAVEWMTMARIVRGQTLMLKQKEFVEAARAAGVKPIGLIETVLIVSGSSARMAAGMKDCPVDAAIVGIVDAVDVVAG
jgi:microcompartment protein CcmK/EutM